ncbi:hypothetical protein OB959_03165 [Aeromonas bestiarum]|uniref:Uncharacterized protein n=1 Tax=Aeromonas bestiarum TaxID=105751 RepID=A0AAW7I3I4_9GAMM|nr:hypothetical protein [Aeromonas bestiarum]MDM5138803.1 hypothetical protein [Aeromonas bestiarum]
MAILNANPVNGVRLAVLDAQLTPQGDGWYQLLPVGPFKARDGRPFDVAIPAPSSLPWVVTSSQGRRPTVSGSAVAIRASVRG